MRPKLFKVEARSASVRPDSAAPVGGKISALPYRADARRPDGSRVDPCLQDAQGRGYVRQVCGGLLVHQQVVDS